MSEKPLGGKYFLKISSSQWKVCLAKNSSMKNLCHGKIPHGEFLL
jgi:hypothetical protein